MGGQIRGLPLLIVAILVLILARASLFTVAQTEQALILRFRQPVPGRGLVTEPGLHYKVPFIEDVIFLDKRILPLESAKLEVVASDNQRLEVDAFMRYHISDPLKFYQQQGNLERANNQLGSQLNSALREVLGDATSSQIISGERAALMGKIRDEVNARSLGFGVSVNDVRIRRADLPKEISEKVYSRMQSERAREAAEFRAKGAEQAQIVRAGADREVVELTAKAQQEADTLRGEGDAKRTAIFAAAFGQDPSFFAFYRSMQAYITALGSKGTQLVISPDSDFFKYFGSETGKAAAGAH
ncbi:MAG: protease modulator HflC [Hyphomicrobiales bacterium]|nr:protease modulator HflC [Hyphomicrobiales bacterium]MDE2115890.1 protease modulator HflC [Hyphomicrobiales bacterium]